MYTPMTSKHFTARIDPKSGMTYYVLSTRVAPIQQGFYFINSGCDDARRYLWFYCAFPPSTGHCAGVIDFASDEVRFFPDTFGSGWMVDPLTGNLYWGNSQGLYMRTANPQDKPVQIARMPEECARFLGSSMGGTHLTFSPDRSELFVDIQSANGSYLGTVDVATGQYRQWYKTEKGIPYNHAQFCPTNPDLVMVAHEGSHSFVTGKHQSPACTPEGIYPRLELIRRDGTREMRRPLNNYATHEWWAASGEAIYYCSQGHIARDRLGALEPESVCYIPIEGGNGTWHAHCTRDERYFIVDGSLKSMGLGWWRGCVSVVRFYNDQTKKLCDLLTYNPIVDGWTPENPCPYHIDPHPRFVWDDQWVTFTTTVAGRVDVAMAPVQQLIDATM
jgi:hypothetical protein